MNFLSNFNVLISKLFKKIKKICIFYYSLQTKCYFEKYLSQESKIPFSSIERVGLLLPNRVPISTTRNSELTRAHFKTSARTATNAHHRTKSFPFILFNIYWLCPIKQIYRTTTKQSQIYIPINNVALNCQIFITFSPYYFLSNNFIPSQFSFSEIGYFNSRYEFH